MARTGRFGTLPANAPELTSTIVALMEEYERQRDRNILSAWQSGGDFEGKPVTDERLKQWFLSRKAQYTKDDPEYDYWDQQYQQIDYDIEESKTLLKFAQSPQKSSDLASVARWYTTNAKRFPKDSEAWREAMRNAAQYKKASQEKSHVANTVSDYEKYNKAVTTIQRNKVDPAIKGMGIVDEALARMGITPDGFMSLDANQRAAAQTKLEQFMRDDPDGARFGRAWKRLTGQQFTYNSMRRVIRTGKQGADQQAGVARKYGYSPLQYQQTSREFKNRDTALAVFRSNVTDDYIEQQNDYQQDLKNAKSPAERELIRKAYAKSLRAEERRAAEMGDSVLAGQIRAKRMNVLGQGNGVFDVQYLDQTMAPSSTPGAGDRELHLNPDGSLNIEMYPTEAEKDWAYAQYDQQAIEGLQSGKYVYVDPKGDGTLIPVELAKLKPTTEQYASTPYSADGVDTTVYVPWSPVMVTIEGVTGGSTTFQMPNTSVAVLNGKTVYKTLENGRFITTVTPPYDDTGEVDDPLYQTTRERSDETWGEVQTGDGAKVYGLTVHIAVTPEEYAKLGLAAVKQTGETQEQVDQRVAATRVALLGTNERPAQELGTLQPSDRPNAEAAARPAEEAPPAGVTADQWNRMKALVQGGATPASAMEQVTGVAMTGRPVGSQVEIFNRLGQTQAQTQSGAVPALGDVLHIPVVFSDALKSKDDLTGASVTLASTRASRDQAVKTIDPQRLMEHLLTNNNVQRDDVARQYELAKETDSVLGVGAPGQEELDYIQSRPGSSLRQVATKMEEVRNFLQQRQGITPATEQLGFKPAGIWSWLTGSQGGMTYDQARQRFPELEPDISGEPKAGLGPPAPINLREFFTRWRVQSTEGVTGQPEPAPAPSQGEIPRPEGPPPSVAPQATPSPTPSPTPLPSPTPTPQPTLPQPALPPIFGVVMPTAKAVARYDPTRFKPSPTAPPALGPAPASPPPVSSTSAPQLPTPKVPKQYAPSTTSWQGSSWQPLRRSY